MRNEFIHGKYIMILGPDGCGKTSVSNWLEKEIIKTEIIKKEFSFGILPSFSKIFFGKKKGKRREGEINSGMLNSLNIIRGSIIACWYGLDHYLGTYYLKRNRQKTIIFARSYYDFLYQRAYRNVPAFIYKFFFKVGPNPDLILVPFREPVKIYSDKPELSIDEIEMQYKILKNFFLNEPKFVYLDASKGIENTIDNLRNIYNKNLI